ncbi:hypothetical protein BS47DRAFT_1348509 [Hydnum rufescens UP504]|uniref:Uncharacterized protein n=1 Tax=Hydnum rufescens UP504 TaxID=1448309 RepID=A0A9P6AQS4_9AGAM|nr:hypothetical protein BS47DRAFT_1348509 [Hydnum rufescens UP504]
MRVESTEDGLEHWTDDRKWCACRSMFVTIVVTVPRSRLERGGVFLVYKERDEPWNISFGKSIASLIREPIIPDITVGSRELAE